MEVLRKFPWSRAFAVLLWVAALTNTCTAIMIEGRWVEWLCVTIGALVLYRVEKVHDIIKRAAEEDDD